MVRKTIFLPFIVMAAFVMLFAAARPADAAVTQDNWVAGADQYTDYLERLQLFPTTLSAPVSKAYKPAPLKGKAKKSKAAKKRYRKDLKLYRATVAKEKTVAERRAERAMEDLDLLVRRATEDSDTNQTNRDAAIDTGYELDYAALEARQQDEDKAAEEQYIAQLRVAEDSLQTALGANQIAYESSINIASEDFNGSLVNAENTYDAAVKKCKAKKNKTKKQKKARTACMTAAQTAYDKAVEGVESRQAGFAELLEQRTETADTQKDTADELAEGAFDRASADIERKYAARSTYAHDARVMALDRRREQAEARSDRQLVEETRLIEDAEIASQRMIEDIFEVDLG